MAGGPGCGLRSQETPLYSPAQGLGLQLQVPAGERGSGLVWKWDIRSPTRTHWLFDPAHFSLPGAHVAVVRRLGPAVLSGTVSSRRGRPASYDPFYFLPADMGSLQSWWTLWAGATLLWGKSDRELIPVLVPFRGTLPAWVSTLRSCPLYKPISRPHPRLAAIGERPLRLCREMW